MAGDVSLLATLWPGPQVLAQAAILVPLAGALVAFVLTVRLAVVVTVPLGLAVALGLAVSVAQEGPVRVALGGWTAPLGIGLRADGPAAVFLAMTAVVMAGVALFVDRDRALGDLTHENGRRRAGLFWTLTFLLWAGLAAAFLTHDLFNMYVALELTSLSGIALVAFAGGAAPLVAQMRYLFQATFGSLLFLMGVALVYGQAGVLDMALAGQSLGPSVTAGAAALLVTLGLMMKSAIWPLHAWLPPAHASAPAPVSAMLSALVVKASLYLLIRLWADTFSGLATPSLLGVIGVFGAGAILWGSLMALVQQRLKLMIAYSTLAQLGYALLALPLAGMAGLGAGLAWSAALLHLVSHGLAKAALFLAAGALAGALGSDDRAALAGAGRRCPVPVFVLGLAGLSIMALPPSGGFLAKWLLLGAAIEQGRWLIVAVLVSGGLLAAGYLARFVLPVFAPMTDDAPLPVDARAGRKDLAALVLALVSLALGLAAAPVFDLLAVTASGTLAPLAPQGSAAP
ncbi:MAG: complex I subunit 5 family protein [Alphaproteobacteria bacterium]